MKCPNCAEELSDGGRHYWMCIEFMGRGCDSLWAKSKNGYFTGLYVIDEMGIIAYIQSAREGGKIIDTNKLLSEHKWRKL